VILLIAGSVMMTSFNEQRRNWKDDGTGFFDPPPSGDNFIGMIVAGAVLIALSCICAGLFRYNNAEQYEEWAKAHPEAARAFEARGGYEAVPHILLPTEQKQATPVQVIVVQSNNTAVATGIPSGYVATGIPNGYGQAAAAAPIVHNHLVYPQQAQTAPVPVGGDTNRHMTVLAQPGARTKYFYKPEFRGQRLTPEQMDPAGAAAAAAVAAAVLQAQQQQQQATTMMVQPGVVTGRPVISAWAPTGPNPAANPPPLFSHAHSPPPAPAAMRIPLRGLQSEL
jgi:hypothetical protein